MNVSVTLIGEKARKSKMPGLAKAVELMDRHANDLGGFLTKDEKGMMLPSYLASLAEALAAERDGFLEDLSEVRKTSTTSRNLSAFSKPMPPALASSNRSR